MLCFTEAPFVKKEDVLTLHSQRWLCNISKVPFTKKNKCDRCRMAVVQVSKEHEARVA